MMTPQVKASGLEKIDKREYMEYRRDFDTDIHLRLVILSSLEGGLGELWRLNTKDGSYALLLRTDVLAALVGDATQGADFYGELFDQIKRHTMIFADQDRWIGLVKSHYGFRFVTRKKMRYSFDEQSLDLDHLYALKDRYESRYDYSKVEFRMIQPADADHLSDYLFGYFEMFADMDTLTSSRLCHVAVSESGRILSIAGTTDEPVNKHYEVQIATERDARKRGLGMMVTIIHLIHALEQGLWPHWDAASKVSADIAEKLGYGDRMAYDVHFHTTYFVKLLRVSMIPKLVITILRKLGKLQD